MQVIPAATAKRPAAQACARWKEDYDPSKATWRHRLVIMERAPSLLVLSTLTLGVCVAHRSTE